MHEPALQWVLIGKAREWHTIKDYHIYILIWHNIRSSAYSWFSVVVWPCIMPSIVLLLYRQQKR